MRRRRRTRAGEATTQAQRQRDEAAYEAERLLSRARREAEQIVVAARKQAEQVAAHSNADVERRISASRKELGNLHRRRDHIVAQLAGLRDLVASFSGDDEDVEVPSEAMPQRVRPEVAAGEPSAGDDTQVVPAVTDDQATQVIPTARPDAERP